MYSKKDSIARGSSRSHCSSSAVSSAGSLPSQYCAMCSAQEGGPVLWRIVPAHGGPLFVLVVGFPLDTFQQLGADAVQTLVDGRFAAAEFLGHLADRAVALVAEVEQPPLEGTEVLHAHAQRQQRSSSHGDFSARMSASWAIIASLKQCRSRRFFTRQLRTTLKAMPHAQRTKPSSGEKGSTGAQHPPGVPANWPVPFSPAGRNSSAFSHSTRLVCWNRSSASLQSGTTVRDVAIDPPLVLHEQARRTIARGPTARHDPPCPLVLCPVVPDGDSICQIAAGRLHFLQAVRWGESIGTDQG